MILAFHKVEPRFSWGVTNYSPCRFSRLLDVICALSQTVESPNVSLTFDDGYQSFLRFAAPILAEHEMTVTVFALSGYLGRRNSWDYSSVLAPSPHMTAAELCDAARQGHRIESHTHTHRDLRFLPERELRAELADSKRQLEDILGTAVTEICYPFGLYDSRVEEVSREVGYLRGWSMNPSDAGPFTFGRRGVYSFDTPLNVWAKMNPDSLGARVETLKLHATNLMARAGRFAFWTDS